MFSSIKKLFPRAIQLPLFGAGLLRVFLRLKNGEMKMANIFKPRSKRRIAAKKMKPLKAIPQAKSIIRKSWENTALWLLESCGASWVKHDASGLEVIINDKYITICEDWDHYKIVVSNKDNIEDNVEYTRLDIVDLEWNKWIA